MKATDCEDFGKIVVDTEKCAIWDEANKTYDVCPLIEACAKLAGVHK